VRRSSLSHLLAVLLSLAAVCLAQTSQIRAAFLCLCGDQAIPTEASHCHGPHGDHCHSDQPDTDPLHHEEDSGPREDHPRIHPGDWSLLSSKSLELIPPHVLPSFFALCHWHPHARSHAAAQSASVFAPRGAPAQDPPPVGIQIARTVILQI
jgi:hypothetical protein